MIPHNHQVCTLSTGLEAGKQTSVAADFAIWRCASPFAFPWADVTLEFTFVSMPTSSTVTVSTVTLAMAWKQMRMHIKKLMSSPRSLLQVDKQISTHSLNVNNNPYQKRYGFSMSHTNEKNILTAFSCYYMRLTTQMN